MSSTPGGAARALLLLLVTVAVYTPVFDARFLHDDDELLTANPIVHRGGRGFGPEARAGLRELWVPAPGALTRFHLPGIPVTATALWLEWRLFGTDEVRAAPEERGLGAPGYHVVNVLLHALCALLLWRVLGRLAVPGAWWAALLWAVHPVCVESVAWISEQKNTLSMAFLLASCHAWIRWSDTGSRAGWVCSLIGLLLALLAKPTAVPFPLVLLLLGWWRRRPLGAELRAALPFFGLALAAGLFALYTQASLAIGAEPIAIGSPLERIYQASFALGFYLWKGLVPFGLILVYPRWHETLPWTLQIVPGLLAAMLLVLSWRARDRWGRHVVLGLGGFGLMLGPVLGLVPISYLRHTLVADHFAYSALPFLVALLVGSAASWQPARRKTQLTAAAALLAAVFAWQTASYAAKFSDRDTLWSHVLAKNPGSWAAHDQRGLKLMAEGRAPLALEHFERAIALAPDRAEVHNNIAVLLDGMGERERALAHILQAAALTPDNGPIRINCAIGLLGAGQPRESLPHFEAALRLLPDDPLIRINYGTALLQVGRPRAAIEQLERALTLDPARPGARRLLAAAQRMLAEEQAPAPVP
jgi:tetratricopeptide (TPR) repeat protein